MEGTKRVLKRKEFIESLPNSSRSFATQFVNTQIFEGLLLTLEQQANGEAPRNESEAEIYALWSLLEQCIDVLNEEDELKKGVERVRTYLHPKNWRLQSVHLPIVDKEIG